MGCKPDSSIEDTKFIPTNKQPANVIRIDPDIQFQIIESFGVSGDWWAQEIGGWQADNRQKVINLLFDPKNGIGLTSYRYHIGSGGGGEIIDPWKKSESFEILPGKYDWNRDANAIRILQMVRNLGVDEILAIAFSPPPRLTQSGSVSGSVDGRSNLIPNKENEYAKYLVDIIAHLIKGKDIPIGFISPVYEPSRGWDLSTGQEGCHFTPSEIINLLIEIQQQMITNNISTEILIPENENWNVTEDYLNEFLYNPLIGPNISTLSFHSYESTVAQKIYLSGLIYDNFVIKGIRMTEWTEDKPGRDISMDSAITLATTIYEDITYGRINSWMFGFAVSKYDTHEGLIYTYPHSQEIIETKRLWAFGNFSRFVRPGYIHIFSEVNNTGLLTAAFKASEQDQIILVVINPTSYSIDTSIDLQGLNWFQSEIFETSAGYNLSKISKGTIASSYTFPAKSVTTLIVSR